MKVMVEKENETLPRDLPTSLARDTHAMARQNPFGGRTSSWIPAVVIR